MSSEASQPSSIGEYFGAVRRRYIYVITIVPIVIFMSICAAFGITPQYQSTATIMLELSSVPKDIIEKNILPQIPVNRLGEPEEIARSVVFLAADEAGFITGSTLSVNGGQYQA